MIQASLVILIHIVAAMIFSWLYFRRYVMTRLPIGVFNLADILIMIGAIILVPFLYLRLPTWMVAGLLTLVTLSILYFTWEPVLRSTRAIWLATIFLVAADLYTALVPRVDSLWFFVVNNVVIMVCVVGVTNLWAQSGMKARDAAILGVALAVYDFIATALLPLMTDLFIKLDRLPFTPELAWPVNTVGDRLGIGLGDLVLVTVFPLVMRKAFGRTAGMAALFIGIGAITVLISNFIFGFLVGAFPVMVVLGPLMIVQYAYWVQQRPERTTWQYLQAEPMK